MVPKKIEMTPKFYVLLKNKSDPKVNRVIDK